jgi:hypothetical protein
MTLATFSARRGAGEARREGDEGDCWLLLACSSSARGVGGGGDSSSGAAGGSSSDGEDSFVSKASM